MKDTALKFSGIIFLLISLLHLVRLVSKTQVIVGGWVVPLGMSMIGFIVALLLSFWMFKSAK